MIDWLKVGWLAGLLEGEGSFYKRPNGPSGSIQVTVCMTDRDVIGKVGEAWSNKPYMVQYSGRKDSYRVSLWGRRAARFMQSFRPLMGNRRQGQIDKALAAYRPQHRTNCDIKGCARKHYAKGLCNIHYQRQRGSR